jgi:type I restriction enzyme R subunit/putative DNA methylase
LGAARELHLFELHAFAVMPNHVHVLLSSCVPLARLTKGIKRLAASKANELLGRTGQRFWQEESFDHWIRNAAEFERVKHYIEWNPVKAGLCKRPEDWPWSSASRGSTGS